MNPPDKTFDCEQLGTVDNAVTALTRVCTVVCLDNNMSGSDFVHCVKCPLYHALHILRRLSE